MNLTGSVRKWVLENLPYDKTDAQLDAYLKGSDAHGLLVIFHNWTSRLIFPRPRQVHQSATFAASLAASLHKEAIEEIIDDIEQGRDLRKYLSRGIGIPAQVPLQKNKFNRRRDLDLLLTSWHIHHLHLGSSVEADGFVSRTQDLLFGVFRQNDAYLVDVVGHGGWYQDNLLRILMNELPDAKVVFELRGVVGLSHEPDEGDIKTLRNAGVHLAHMIDGKAIMPAGLVSGAGTSESATSETDALLESLEAFEKEWSQHPERIRSLFIDAGFPLPEIPIFEFIITEMGPGIYEQKAKAFYPL